MTRTTAVTRWLPEPSEGMAGPTLGMCDAAEPATASPNKARFLGNLFRGGGPAGTGQQQRPGFARQGEPVGGLVQVASTTWTQYNGIALTFQVAAGQVWVKDAATNGWSLALSSAQLAGAGCTLSPTAQVAAVPFADYLHFSDGVNPLVRWDGTIGGGLLAIPVILFGVPTVYASQLVGIMATARNTMIWSEPGDSTRGYNLTVAGRTYSNIWDNVGGLTEPMTALKGRNEGLYVFRARSFLAVYGAMGPDFRTSHTRADGSTTVGTSSPWAIVDTDFGLIAPDSDGVPQLFRLGLPPAPVGQAYDYLVTVQPVATQALRFALGAYEPGTDQFLLGLPVEGSSFPSLWLAFHAKDLQFNGVWAWGTAAARASSSIGLYLDPFGKARWVHADAETGENFVHGDPQSGPLNDEEALATVPVTSLFLGPQLGYDLNREFIINQAQAGFAGASSVDIWVETSRGAGQVLSYTFEEFEGAFVLDESELDGDDGLGGVSSMEQATTGHFSRGRWGAYCWRHSVLDETIVHDVHKLLIGITQGNPRVP